METPSHLSPTWAVSRLATDASSSPRGTEPYTRSAFRASSFHIAAFLVAAVIVILRRPDAVFHPVFYAEDGAAWYADAYNIGILRPLFTTLAGYFQTFPRLIADISLLLPLRYAPLFMNCVAIAVQVLPVNVLLSKRTADWGPLWFRALLALSYLALPNSQEVHANLTNAQWHLALLALMLTIAKAPSMRASKIFDCTISSLSALTGPFVILQLPFAIAMRYLRRDSWAKIPLLIAAVGVCIQVFGLITGDARSHSALGASYGMLVRLVGAEAFCESVRGLSVTCETWPLGLVSACAIAGLAVVGFVFVRGPFWLRCMIVYGVVILGAALHSPEVELPGYTRWVALTQVVGCRYFFIASLVCSWSILWLVFRSREMLARVAGAILLLLLSHGIRKDWTCLPMVVPEFESDIQRFNQAKTGDLVAIHAHPDWMFHLRKK